MKGDECVRRCGDCDREVYDLSSLTRREAETMLAELDAIMKKTTVQH